MDKERIYQILTALVDTAQIELIEQYHADKYDVGELPANQRRISQQDVNDFEKEIRQKYSI